MRAALLALILVAGCALSAKKPTGSGTGGSATGTGGSATGTGGSATGAGGASAASCTADADCRLFSDYCGGCNCRPLAASDPDPTCPTPPVSCLVDPCRDQKAACKDGRCTAVAGRGYDPCAGKKCGDPCRLCAPDDANCMETAVMKQCNAQGTCTHMDPGCR